MVHTNARALAPDVSAHIRDTGRQEKNMSQSCEKGRRIFQQFSVIKPLENNSSNRYIILPVTGVERGSRVEYITQYFLFGALETSHCAGQPYYTIG